MTYKLNIPTIQMYCIISVMNTGFCVRLLPINSEYNNIITSSTYDKYCTEKGIYVY